MKQRFCHAAVTRNIQPGDKVLVLLPLLGSALSARFMGPYKILERLSDIGYLIKIESANLLSTS